LEKNHKSQWYWVLFISIIFLAGTFAGIYINVYIGETKALFGIYYTSWVIIFQLLIVISTLVYFRKKKNKIWYLKCSFIEKNRWIEWPILFPFILILMLIAMALFYTIQ
jgi:ABC-type Fe3+-siderophore transport system permease subunit